MRAKAVVPYLGYKDASKAIKWLSNAFGFQEHLVVPGDNGLIVHAELKLDNVMIMLGNRQKFLINDTVPLNYGKQRLTFYS